MGNELLVAALKIAARGWEVFPCYPGKKNPATVNGLKDATLDISTIVNWWTRQPDCNVGVCTGSRSGIVVLDIDGEDGYASLNALQKQHEPLPPTLSVVTPSGGQHFYFRYDADDFRNTAGRLGLGIDTRGEGGYVLAPPSQVNGRRYEVDEWSAIIKLPEWLLQATHPRGNEDGSQSTDEWIQILSGAREGERNHAIARLAGYLLRRYIHLDVTKHLCHTVNQMRFKPPLPNWEVDQAVESILDRELRRREAEADRELQRREVEALAH